MAKKNSGRVIQMLTPENYIRKKARMLPIYKCLLNPEWQEEGIAHVIVVRSHSNGNLTLCFYLVDLFCLGIKDTHYRFNITITEYQELLEQTQSLDFEEITYELAHNIVFAGVEYAEEFEFKPHKDFTSITQYMLEEDTDDVELIEIECGKDGKPFYIAGPNDDKGKINKILAQLERTAGPGNYDFLLEVKSEDENSNESEFDRMSYDEKRSLYLDLYTRQENLTDDEFEKFENLIRYIIENVTNPDEVEQFTENFLDDFDFELTPDNLTAEMLGFTEQQVGNDTSNLFIEIYSKATSDVEDARKLFKEFSNDYPETPAACFLDLIIVQKENIEKYAEKLKEYYSKFPKYPLLKILMVNDQILGDDAELENILELFNMQTIFLGRTLIHNIEAFNFISTLLMLLFRLGNLDHFEGLCEAYPNLEFSDLEIETLDHLVFLMKTHFVKNLFNAS